MVLPIPPASALQLDGFCLLLSCRIKFLEEQHQSCKHRFWHLGDLDKENKNIWSDEMCILFSDIDDGMKGSQQNLTNNTPYLPLTRDAMYETELSYFITFDSRKISYIKNQSTLWGYLAMVL